MAFAVYWDTSALLKLYAPERDSDDCHPTVTARFPTFRSRPRPKLSSHSWLMMKDDKSRVYCILAPAVD
jgi:hypothetical protein